MEPHSSKTGLNSFENTMEAPASRSIDHLVNLFSKEDMITAFEKIIEVKDFFQKSGLAKLVDLLDRLSSLTAKKSFLVFKSNKYVNVPTENIAFFFIKYDSPVIKCFDQQEYFVNHSLDQVQSLLPEKQFFRLNRQYLINFQAIKEVEHYFARKLLVNSIVPLKDKLIIPKEKVSEFLHWLDNR